MKIKFPIKETVTKTWKEKALSFYKRPEKAKIDFSQIEVGSSSQVAAAPQPTGRSNRRLIEIGPDEWADPVMLARRTLDLEHRLKKAQAELEAERERRMKLEFILATGQAENNVDRDAMVVVPLRLVEELTQQQPNADKIIGNLIPVVMEAE